MGFRLVGATTAITALHVKRSVSQSGRDAAAGQLQASLLDWHRSETAEAKYMRLYVCVRIDWRMQRRQVGLIHAPPFSCFLTAKDPVRDLRF
jgi:hypothetical protein